MTRGCRYIFHTSRTFLLVLYEAFFEFFYYQGVSRRYIANHSGCLCRNKKESFKFEFKIGKLRKYILIIRLRCKRKKIRSRLILRLVATKKISVRTKWYLKRFCIFDSSTLFEHSIGHQDQLLEEIKRLLQRDWEVSVADTYCEGNMCADKLANLGLGTAIGLVEYKNSPLEVMPLVLGWPYHASVWVSLLCWALAPYLSKKRNLVAHCVLVFQRIVHEPRNTY